MNIDVKAYTQGLQDAMAQIDAELDCVALEYADSEPCRLAATRALTNARLLVSDKLQMINGSD